MPIYLMSNTALVFCNFTPNRTYPVTHFPFYITLPLEFSDSVLLGHPHGVVRMINITSARRHNYTLEDSTTTKL